MPDVAPFPWIHPITAGAVGIVSVVTLMVYCLLPATPKALMDKKSHAIITGGSSGVGLGLAKECAKAGVKNVTLVARTKSTLEKVQTELSAAFPATKFHVQPLDVGNMEAVAAATPDMIKNGGPPTLLFNNAGVTAVHSFHDVPIEDFERLMKCNYLGTVYMCRALLPHMSSGSSIILTSSMAGATGVFGYTCYSPTKFAIRGFAEALQAEIRRDGITVSLAFPPDVDTPMYQAENLTKPRETFLISEAAALMKPEVAAKKIVAYALSSHPPFFIYFALEGWMLQNLTAGMGPVHGLVDAVCQVFLMGLFRLISLFYIWDFSRIIAKEGKQKKD